MKSTLASLLVFNAFGALPDGALSFTARPPLAVRPTDTDAVARRPTELHGLLPGFLNRNKNKEEETVEAEAGVAFDAVPPASEGAMSSEMTELALETGGEASAAVEEVKEEEEETSETEKLLQKVKQAGTAGAISYALWELGFWGISIPVCVVGYQQVTGHWPDFSNSEDMQKVGAEAFAFVNFARLAVPLRIGLALGTTPWIDENIVQKIMKKDGEEEEEAEK